MTYTPFDFDDEFGQNQSESEPYDTYMTVRGLLATHFGTEHGDEIYELLLRTAKASTDNIDAETVPGILFTDEGGEFVGFEKDAVDPFTQECDD